MLASENNAKLINQKFSQLPLLIFVRHGIILLMWYNFTATSCTKSKLITILLILKAICLLYREVTAVKLSPDGNTVFSISQGM